MHYRTFGGLLAIVSVCFLPGLASAAGLEQAIAQSKATGLPMFVVGSSDS